MKIAVVGSCASGKTTIVTALRERGHEAYVVSQEHSIITELWRHLDPEYLVLLEADFEVVRQRRGGTWPRWLFDLQQERLRHAREHADLILDTGTLSIEQSLQAIEAAVGDE